MVVVYSKREDFIRTRVEPFFHAISILAPLATGIFLIATTSFNEAGNLCWIAPFPMVCSAPWADPDVGVECTRGKNAMAYRSYFQILPLILILLIVIACMIRLSWAIRAQMKKNDKYGSNQFEINVAKKRRANVRGKQPQPGTQLQYRNKSMNASEKSKTERKETFIQAMLYVVALLMTFFFAFVYQVVSRKHYWVYILQIMFLPLLGFFNFFIFIRPRVYMTRQCKPELSFFRAFFIAVTAKEVKPPAGRRGSVRNRFRRSSQPFLGQRNHPTPRGSCLSSNSILAAVQIVQREEELKEEEASEANKIEDERELEDGFNKIETNSLPDSTSEHESSLSNPLPSSSPEIQVLKDIDTTFLPDSTIELESNVSNDLPSSSPDSQVWKDTPVLIKETAALDMTEDYHNMI